MRQYMSPCSLSCAMNTIQTRYRRNIFFWEILAQLPAVLMSLREAHLNGYGLCHWQSFGSPDWLVHANAEKETKWTAKSDSQFISTRQRYGYSLSWKQEAELQLW